MFGDWIFDWISQILWDTIDKIPCSRLARVRDVKNLNELRAIVDDINDKTGELFFDRHPGAFNSVLNFYR